MKKRLVIFGILIVAAGAVWFGRGVIRDAVIEYRKTPIPSEQPRPTPTPSVAEESETPEPTPTPRPEAGMNLAVPFYAQAPDGDWTLPWQEACEEASAILVDAYWQDDPLSVDEMKARILALVVWQTERFGSYEHTTAADTAVILREVMGYERVDVKYDVDIDDILAHVRAGRPVIVPLAGRLLGNPYYTAPGPVYHMLVVKGVTDDGKIITNDVGTRHGKDYVYDPAVFLAAMHDVPESGAAWPSGVDPAEYIKTGKRAIVVVYQN
ncbi:MAG TPA: C39 family peptidase [Candidatus Paceibacterota bacterium]|nr:C39 family peptidase [Candidatus Paceibacterota bacterium]